MSSDISPAYNPNESEGSIYKTWEDAGCFLPSEGEDVDPFVVIMPPPNVTGELHMGHALTTAIEDMIVRWHRMKGAPTLFLPGTDHAGIATQVVVERLLASEGVSRHDLGREEFEARIWQWVEEYGSKIYQQLRRLGASCDWTRQSFTLDEGPRNAVRKTFIDLYKDGLIYRGERITNWCPRCSTALSDLEVRYAEEEGFLYEIEYRYTDDDGGITIATTRPETMLGDAAVAVNPTDQRFSHVQGKNVLIPIAEREVPIIQDLSVEADFGTGALKVTPGHDPTDFEIGLRHKLPTYSVMNLDGSMNENTGRFKGVDRFDCRKEIVDLLRQSGNLKSSHSYTHSVGHCDRCSEIVEPILTNQWYVSMKPLAEPALEAVKDGRIKIIPDRFKGVYFNWMENIRDWTLSRQLWWGHQIPVWYCDECGEEIVEYLDPVKCTQCESSNLSQDPDVLDTWFSSGLWTHSTLGWPEQTKDLERFYPGSVLETGYDILFFWVARMIMLGLYNTGDIPFHTVYLHGLVLDPEGVKMSKTKGNVLDPLALIDQYGADAVRFALTTGNSAGNNMRLNEQRLEASRNFANKLWNAARFVLSNIEDRERSPNLVSRPISTNLQDRWILSKLELVKRDLDRFMSEYQLGEAQKVVHDFLWNDYCDWYIEMAKIRIRAGSREPVGTLVFVLEQVVRLLHPFLPFVTEQIWSNLSKVIEKQKDCDRLLITASYPEHEPGKMDEECLNNMDHVFEVIKGIRNVRAEFKVGHRDLISADISSSDHQDIFISETAMIMQLAGLSDLKHMQPETATLELDQSLSLILAASTVRINFDDSVKLAEESSRLTEELEELTTHLERLKDRLNDQQFTTKAPAAVVEKEKDRMKSTADRVHRLRELLGGL